MDHARLWHPLWSSWDFKKARRWCTHSFLHYLWICVQLPLKKKKKKGNSYLKKQIRGAKDKKAQIPCRASVHPCIQRVPGHRPATGAALTGCGRTQREAAGAVTAGVVVTHPAKIQVIGMGEGKKQKDIASKPHQVLTDIPLLPSTLISPPLLPFYTSFKHHWHSLALVPALTGNRHSHTQRRSPSRGAAAVAAIPVHSWLSVCVYVCVRKAGRGWAGGWMGGWIWQREEGGGGGEGGGVRGQYASCWGKSTAAELHHRRRPPQLVLHRLALLTPSCYIIWRASGDSREGELWNNKCIALLIGCLRLPPLLSHILHIVYEGSWKGGWMEQREGEVALHKGGGQRRRSANRAAVLMRIWDQRENEMTRGINRDGGTERGTQRTLGNVEYWLSDCFNFLVFSAVLGGSWLNDWESSFFREWT